MGPSISPLKNCVEYSSFKPQKKKKKEEKRFLCVPSLVWLTRERPFGSSCSGLLVQIAVPSFIRVHFNDFVFSYKKK